MRRTLTVRLRTRVNGCVSMRPTSLSYILKKQRFGSEEAHDGSHFHPEWKTPDRGRLAADAAAMGLARHARHDRHQIRLRHGAVRRCTVHINGQPIRSCVTPISTVAGKSVTTIEGLSADSSHPVQRAWIEVDVPQCGYCQSGQIMTAAALLTKTAHPTDADIDEAMHGNICRCGTYQAIRRAVHLAAQYQAAPIEHRGRRRNGRRCGMSATTRPKLNRRGFLKAGAAAAGGLFIGFYLPESNKLEAAATSAKLNAFMHIGSDDSVTFVIHKSEMGQGP